MIVTRRLKDPTSTKEEKLAARLRIAAALTALNEALEVLQPGAAAAAVITGTAGSGVLGDLSPRPIAELGVRELDGGDPVLFTEISDQLMAILASKGRYESAHYKLETFGPLLGLADERTVIS